MQQKTFIIFAIAIIIALGLGIFIGNRYPKSSMPADVSGLKPENTYQSGWDAAMKTMKDSGVFPGAPEGVPITLLSGEVVSVSGNTITVKVTDPTLMGNVNMITRTISVDSNTKIQTFTQKDDTLIQKETEIYDEQVKKFSENASDNPSSFPVPPSFQIAQDADLTSIKEGQSITVETKDDIRDKQSFVATKIQIQPTIEMTLPEIPQVDTQSSPSKLTQ